MSISLDFTALPSEQFFATRSILIGLSEPLESRMSSLPLALDRARSAIMFAELSAKQSEEWRAAAYIRAALAEFCSIKEVQKTDRPGTAYFKLENSVNPLLHLLDLARHLNIHVKSVGAQRHAVSVSVKDQKFDLAVFILSDLSAADLAQLWNGKKYSPDDLQKVVDWFSKSQLHWGAGYLVRVGVEALVRELCDHYRL